MPVCLYCGIVLERKKLPEIGKVARNRKSCPKVAEHIVNSLNQDNNSNKRYQTKLKCYMR